MSLVLRSLTVLFMRSMFDLNINCEPLCYLKVLLACMETTAGFRTGATLSSSSLLTTQLSAVVILLLCGPGEHIRQTDPSRKLLSHFFFFCQKQAFTFIQQLKQQQQNINKKDQRGRVCVCMIQAYAVVLCYQHRVIISQIDHSTFRSLTGQVHHFLHT